MHPDHWQAVADSPEEYAEGLAFDQGICICGRRFEECDQAPCEASVARHMENYY